MVFGGVLVAHGEMELSAMRIHTHTYMYITEDWTSKSSDYFVLYEITSTTATKARARARALCVCNRKSLM